MFKLHYGVHHFHKNHPLLVLDEMHNSPKKLDVNEYLAF